MLAKIKKEIGKWLALEILLRKKKKFSTTHAPKMAGWLSVWPAGLDTFVLCYGWQVAAKKRKVVFTHSNK